MKKYTVTPIKMGELTVDKGSLTRNKDGGKTIVIPIWAAAVEGNGHKIIVDTGVHDPDWVTENVCPCTQAADETMDAALKKLGWSADEVDIVINTHLHYDHCGNNAMFKNAKFYIQRAEWEGALSPMPHQEGIYLKKLFNRDAINTTRLVLVDGEMTIDDGVVLIPSAGHSLGHQSVIVSTEKGVVCVAGDALNMLENLTENLIPNIIVDSKLAYKAMNDIGQKAEFVIPGHDPAVRAYDTEGYLQIHSEREMFN